MEKGVNDFFVACGNNMDAELETFKLFGVVRDPKTKNGRVIYGLRAVDVNVHRGGGFYFLNLLFGRPNVVGKLDLDRLRECTVDEFNNLLLKEGKPSVFLGLPDRFEDLPLSVKINPVWGTSLKLGYLQMQSKRLQEEILLEAGFQQAEIQDILSQSQTKLNEFIIKSFSDYASATESQLKSQVKPVGEQKSEDVGGKFY